MWAPPYIPNTFKLSCNLMCLYWFSYISGNVFDVSCFVSFELWRRLSVLLSVSKRHLSHPLFVLPAISLFSLISLFDPLGVSVSWLTCFSLAVHRSLETQRWRLSQTSPKSTSTFPMTCLTKCPRTGSTSYGSYCCVSLGECAAAKAA